MDDAKVIKIWFGQQAGPQSSKDLTQCSAHLRPSPGMVYYSTYQVKFSPYKEEHP